MRRTAAAWAIAAAFALLAAAGTARAQVSPGPLAAPHADLDDLKSCFACHARGQAMSQRCLACHGEIAWSRSQRRGLHAQDGFAEYESCHPDHAGRDFKGVVFVVGAVRSRPQPDISRHGLRNGLFGQPLLDALGPYRTVGPGVNLFHRSNGP